MKDESGRTAEQKKKQKRLSTAIHFLKSKDLKGNLDSKGRSTMKKLQKKLDALPMGPEEGHRPKKKKK